MSYEFNRDKVFAKTEWQCFYCQSEATTIDHMIPTSRGGSDHIVNLVGACERCNQEKGDMTIDEYIVFREQPFEGKKQARHSAAVRLNRGIQKDRAAALNPIQIPDFGGVKSSTQGLMDAEPDGLSCKKDHATQHEFPPNDIQLDADLEKLLPNWMR